MKCSTFQELLNAVKANVETELYATGFRFKDEDIKILSEALKTNTSLQSLELSMNDITDDGALHLANALKTHKTLKVLNLSDNKITDIGAQHLANALEVNISLQTLNMSHNLIGNQGARYIAKALESNKTLQELNIKRNSIGDDGTQYFAKALGTGASLQVLHLSSNDDITDAGMQYLANALETNTSLHELYLQHNKITAVGVQHLANMLKSNKTLQLLALLHNDIGNVGAQYFAEMLKSNNILQKLYIGANNITNAGAQHLAKVLKSNTSLQVLDLRYNDIDEIGAQYLLEALETNTSLQEIHFLSMGAKITFVTLEKIKLKTASNKHLYDSIKYFINEVFDQYVELNGSEKINVTNDHWLEDAIYSNSTNQPKDRSKYAFASIGKVKLLEFFIKHPNPAQFIYIDLQLEIDNFTKIFQDFKKDLSKSYFSKYFHFNRVCKSLKIENDSQSVPSAPKDIDNNNSQIVSLGDGIDDFIRPSKSLKIENDSQSVPSAPNDIDNNNNLQTSNESNTNIFSLLPNDVFTYIIYLVTLNGGGINHSANVQNPDDSMNNAGDKSEQCE